MEFPVIRNVEYWGLFWGPPVYGTPHIGAYPLFKVCGGVVVVVVVVAEEGDYEQVTRRLPSLSSTGIRGTSQTKI